MPTPEVSDTTTDGIRVGATGFFIPEESNPDDKTFVFGYQVVIKNEGEVPATLLARHWVIIDGNGHREEVRGEGVVGQKPRLEPGQRFKYTSFCPLSTPWGTMEGSYQMKRDDGKVFEAQIKRFYLHLPVSVPAGEPKA